MKTLRAWDNVVDPLNVWGAWRDYARGKRRRPAVARFALDAASQVNRLAAQLRDQAWRPGAYRVLRITDPKRRLIAAAPVRDRVVHHALHRVVAPGYDRRFIDHSYACRAGRGSHRAVLRFREGLRRFRYVLQLDIRRYFYSIDRDVLFGLLTRALPEPAMADLIRRILASGAALYTSPEVAAFLGWSEPTEPGRGLPIGNLTSQWWGNVYLDGVDHFAQRELRVPLYQRYMDDLALMADDRDELLGARDAVATWLDEHRGLRLRDEAARPRRTTGRHPYLGYAVSRVGFAPGARQRRRAGPLAMAGNEATARAVAASWLWPTS